jgi:hypothetical protein
MQKNTAKKTLKEIHSELTKQPATKRDMVMKQLGIKSERTFYAMINGETTLTPAAKEVFAKVYDMPQDAIDFKDKSTPIA